MSKTDRDGDEHLSPAEMAVIREPVRRRLAFFRKHGVWISGEALAADAETGDYEEQMEDTRARARGWSEDEIEEHYGAPNQKKK
jgi:hypothetical protein